jgi:hypothetical protein
MSKKTSDSFILELPLKTSPEESKELDKRLEAARHLYNACLGECLRRMALLRQSKGWNKARSLPKTPENTKTRRDLFKESQKKYEFSEYSLHVFAADIRSSCWIKNHIDSSSAQKVATKAFNSAKEHLVGKRGKPRFKAYNRYRSVEGKSNMAGIRFKDEKIIWGVRAGKKLELSILFDQKDKYGVQSHALQSRTKYVRLVRKVIRGKQLWYAQLVQEGKPLRKSKNPIGKEIVGLDIGPSTIAIVSDSYASLGVFCEGLQSDKAVIGNLQKRIDRSRRKTNPDHYESDGRIKKGPKKWVRSKRYQKIQQGVAEKQRCLSETRKRMHGELANQVLSQGIFIRTEKLSYKSFQKDYGRSVGFRAPGMFVSLLRRKAESAGGFLEEFSTYKTCLSQTCQCGKRKKKKLSDRWHHCCCGVSAQRDLYSAHLARYVEKDCLNTCQALSTWSAAEPLLERAVLRLEQLAKGKACLSSFGFGQRQSQSRAKEGSLFVEAVDVVGESREPQRANQLAFRTPWL